MTRVLVLAASYLAVQAAALLLTESGDWGLGWTAPWRAPLRSVIAVAIVMAGAVALLAATGFTTVMRRLPEEGWRVAAGVGVLTLCGVLVRPSPADNAAVLALTVIFVSLGLALLAAIASNLPSAAAEDLMRRLASWPTAAMLPYNAALTGRRFYDPITKYFDERYYPGSNLLGFGSDVGNTGWRNDLLPGHSPIEAVLNGHRNLYLLNLELFGWACGSLAAVTLLIFFGRWSWPDAFVTSLAAAIVGALALYWYSGADFGARYGYQLLVPPAMLSPKGLESLAERTRGAVPERVVAGRLAAAVDVAALSAVAILLPWRAATKYHHYRGMGNAIAGLATASVYILAAVPLFLARPALNAAAERGRRQVAASAGRVTPEYDDPRPNRRRFYRRVRERALDLKFGVVSAVTAAFFMAPLTALAGVVFYDLLVALRITRRRALFYAFLVVLGTPLFFRSGYLNRYLVPLVPFLMLGVVVALERMPARTRHAIAIVALAQAWIMAMLRESVPESFASVLAHGPQLPWLTVLGKMAPRYLPSLDGPPPAWPLFLLAAALLGVLWNRLLPQGAAPVSDPEPVS